MHQPRSARSARSMKLGAYALVLTAIAMVATPALLGYAIYSGERSYGLWSLAALALLLTSLVFYRLFAGRAHCPLCRGPILSGSGAQRNRRARRTLGSHRLRVARNIIFTNTFVCPYCNEPTRCTVKQRPRPGSALGGRQ